MTLSYRTMALLSVAAAVLVVVGFSLVHGEDARAWGTHYLGVATSFGVVASAIIAARLVGVSGTLGRAWLCFAVANVLLGLSSVFFPIPSELERAPHTVQLAEEVLVFFYNSFWIVSYVLFARVWSGTGLVPRWRPLALIITGIIAVAITGPALLGHIKEARALSSHGVTFVISDVSDIVSVTIMGSLFVTALALRGGALLWAWLFLALSSLAWMANDVSPYFGPARSVVEASAQIIADVFAATAALMQSKVTLQARREGDAG